jgi:hypothetical protein
MNFCPKLLVFFILCLNFSYGQGFIVVDDETLEFAEDVNFELFLNHNKVSSGHTKNDGATNLPDVAFDSIQFSKVGYEPLGLKKKDLVEAVFLKKKIFALDELVIGSQQNDEIILGERNRFLKARSMGIGDKDFGVAFHNDSKTTLKLEKIAFFIDKIKYKTAYRIHCYRFNNIPIAIGHQKAELTDLLFSTDTLYLFPGQKDLIEVDMKKYDFEIDADPFFITFELLSYCDANGIQLSPDIAQRTKIRFQLSNRADYFSKMTNQITSELSKDLININAMINYDFAFRFFRKPHKSDLVTPALLLYTNKL